MNATDVRLRFAVRPGNVADNVNRVAFASQSGGGAFGGAQAGEVGEPLGATNFVNVVCGVHLVLLSGEHTMRNPRVGVKRKMRVSTEAR